MKWEPPCALAAPVDSEGVAGPRSRRGLPDSVQPHVPDSNAHLPFGLLHLPEVMTRYFVVQAQLASAERAHGGAVHVVVEADVVAAGARELGLGEVANVAGAAVGGLEEHEVPAALRRLGRAGGLRLRCSTRRRATASVAAFLFLTQTNNATPASEWLRLRAWQTPVGPSLTTLSRDTMGRQNDAAGGQ